MLGKFFGLSGSASFHLPGWNTCPNLMCRNLGAMVAKNIGITLYYFRYFFSHKSKNLSYTT